METEQATPKPQWRPPTAAENLGITLYEKLLKYFDDPTVAAEFEEWRRKRKAGIA